MQRRLISWQTRTLAQFISATIEVPKGKENPAMQAANQVSLDSMEAAELAKPRAEPPKENKIGSFERLTGGFGSGHPE